MQLKLTAIGNSTGVILPKELLAKLRLDKGDEIYLTEIPGSFQIHAYNEKFARKMEVGEKVMRENRDALKRLAE